MRIERFSRKRRKFVAKASAYEVKKPKSYLLEPLS